MATTGRRGTLGQQRDRLASDVNAGRLTPSEAIGQLRTGVAGAAAEASTSSPADAPVSDGASSLPPSSLNEYAESHPLPPNEWGAVVQTVSSNRAEVLIDSDTDNTWVPIEVAGVTAGDNVIITFRERGGVALTAIIQQ